MATLPIADSPRTLVFREFVRLVTTDPEMGRLGVKFRAWEGNPDDDQAPGSPEGMPWLRFSPAGGRQEPAGLRKLSIPMAIHVDMLTPGYDVADSMNLWQVFEDLILSQSFRAAMRRVGATRVMPAEAGFGVKSHYPKYEPATPGAIFSAGTIEVDIVRDF
jgi:hypothetical protein